MSFKFYNKFWIATSHDLKNILADEQQIEKLKYTDDRNDAHRILASLYPRYVVLCNNLGEIYDQTLQVQKRAVVGKLLQSVSQRLQELQKKLSQVELSEIIYVDRTLIERKLIPHDITILKPFYFPVQRSVEVQNVLDGIKPVEEVVQELTGLDKFKVRYTPEELEQQRIHQILVDAVNLIKWHEKARHARVLLNNIHDNPDVYSPQPPAPEESVKYDFYHKEDTVMLYPIKRTVYESNFYLEEVNFDDFEYYHQPEIVIDDTPQFGRKKKKVKLSVIQESLLEIIESLPILEAVEEVEEVEDEEKKDRDSAALKIQIAWKYFKLRRRVAEKNIKRLKILNMIDERKLDFSKEEKIEEARLRRRQKKAQFDEVFLKAIEDEKARILKVKAPWLMEDISDHIREWFRVFYEKCKDFDRYPEEFEGGTILVIRGDTMTPEEFEAKKADRAAQKGKTPEQKAKEKEAKKAEKERIKEKARAIKQQKKEELLRAKEREKEGRFRMEFQVKYPEDRSKALGALEKNFSEFESQWYFIDESKDPKEDPILEWITIDKYAEVHMELRPIVDELMRIEYELLRKALAKDLKKKYKPQKKKKKRKGKKGKKGKKKKKEAANLLEENSIQELYDQLVEMRILLKYDRCSLEEYLGDMNYRAYEQRQLILDPMHGNEELKSVLRSSILGMGPLKLPKPKSLLLAGPPLSGKKYLAYALCSDTSSVLFDLSPEKIVGVEDMKYFVQLITQMARLFQPTIFLINGAHKPFYRKIPKTETELEPRKLGKYLIKMMKGFKKDEKIMLIGTSNEPWNSKIGKMKKCYEKILLVPRAEYATTFITWHHELLTKLGVRRDICVSPLAMVTQGLSTGQIISGVEENVGIRRRMKFSRQPLTLEELLEAYIKDSNYPKTVKEFTKYVKWYKKANKLAKKRAKLVLLAHPPENNVDDKKKKT